jgi:uncharacterized protein YndB with AHSA1/START domain
VSRTDRASRVVRAPLDQVFRAFIDRASLETWLPPAGMTARFERFDPWPGGSYRLILTYTDPEGSGAKSSPDSDIVEARYVDIVHDERVVQAIDFVSNDPAFAGTMTMTWAVRATDGGTHVEFTADDVPVGISADDHAAGMASSLQNLADHLERERPDWVDELHQRVDELIDAYRASLHDSLNDLSEEEPRHRLVPSETTLLGLVKHASFVEGVWFDQAITGRSYAEIGIAATVDGSFTLRETDTIASVQAEYRDRWAKSRRNLDGRPLDEVVEGRGARAVWSLKLQVLRELAQHAGHADILREQIIASRSAAP